MFVIEQKNDKIDADSLKFVNLRHKIATESPKNITLCHKIATKSPKNVTLRHKMATDSSQFVPKSRVTLGPGGLFIGKNDLFIEIIGKNDQKVFVRDQPIVIDYESF